jgi:hypothetical protein
VFKDFTVRFNNIFMQILPKQKIQPYNRLFVEIRLNGSMYLRFKGAYLQYQIIQKQPPDRSHHVPSMLLKRKPVAKGKYHPWNQFFLSKKAVLAREENPNWK